MAFGIKTVGELENYRFFVPFYQRGYRWREQEVMAFLDDIWEFSAEEGKQYCLQPLMVKRKRDNRFEVVDGQQRLTTIYLFMQLSQNVPFFQLEYETRENSGEFLRTLSKNKQLEKQREENIDFYHMALAFETMEIWFHAWEDREAAILEMTRKIQKNVFFIWYEIPGHSNPVSMFTKVNVGKIPLTDGELIKALLLNRDIHRYQTEISVSWDKIEQGLQEDSFWYFLNEKERKGTRIDFLLELMAKKYNKALPKPISQSQNYFSFLVFSQVLKDSPNKETCIKQLWSETENLYGELRDWYHDLDKYHMTGYLLACGVKIEEILALGRGKRKSEVKAELLAKAREVTGDIDLPKISYDNRNDRRKIRKLLLLFNIATLVCKSEKQYRFPFDIYKGQAGDRIKWDIEHIHASADETDEADDGMGNLTLLDAGTNRGYQAAPFSEKRKMIIDRESKGLFVPVCTKNVFLKVYSENLIHMDKWEQKDKRDYIKAMEQTFEAFFEGRFGA